MRTLDVIEDSDIAKLSAYWEYTMTEIGMYEPMDYLTYWKNFVGQQGYTKVYCLLDNSADIQGVIGGMLLHGFSGDTLGMLCHFYVSPAFRKTSKAFTLLLAKMQKVFTEQKCSKVIVEISPILEGVDQIKRILLKCGYTHKVSLYEREGAILW